MDIELDRESIYSDQIELQVADEAYNNATDYPVSLEIDSPTDVADEYLAI